MSHQIADLRREYKLESLDENEIHENPIDQFRHWFGEALAADLPEPNAMVLATVSSEGRPSARVVLLKGIDEDGFLFYTNYLSKKGRDIGANPSVALNFNWLELERQVRIEGVAQKVGKEVSEAYFQSRPRGSQIGAWASPQSSVVRGRADLEANVNTAESRFVNTEYLPCPEFWGGYRVIPELIEFWQGRPNRLHDRIQYMKISSETVFWERERLAP